MKNFSRTLLILTFVILLTFLFSIKYSLAKTDLSIAATNITFSKEEPLEGDKIRVFARVFNLGDTDVYGFVIFLKDGKEMSDPQPISVKVNTYDDVFIDWIVTPGNHNIQAKIVSTNLPDDNPDNDKATQEDYFVDSDSDNDGVGNRQDTDDDNDGLADEKEAALGTNPLNPDSDGDRARDNIDPFPLDPKEWQDLDKDGVGDNKDTDDDNDGLDDEEELFVLGTNPLNSDSDEDGLSDKEEINLGTDALREDTDRDGVIDSKDDFPLEPKKAQASLIEAASIFIRESPQLSIGFISILILLLILFLYRNRKHRARE